MKHKLTPQLTNPPKQTQLVFYHNEQKIHKSEPTSEATLPFQDFEGGADCHNGETFGESWALESWSYEEAVAANRKLQAASVSVSAVPSGVPAVGWNGGLVECGEVGDGKRFGDVFGFVFFPP